MERKKFKLIIFDWSGVISDTFDNWHRCAMHVFEVFGVPRLTKQQAREAFRQPYMEFYNAYIPGLSLEDQQRVYVEEMAKCPAPGMFPGINDLLTHIHSKGIPMVVISGDAKTSLLSEVQSYGIGDLFDDIQWDVYHKTEAVREIMQKYSFDPQDVLFVGDSMHEVEVGKEAGCKTCAVTWGFVSKKKLQKLQPDFIVETPQELLSVIY